MSKNRLSRRGFLQVGTAGGLATAIGAAASPRRAPGKPEALVLDSPIGKKQIDITGSPVGVVRLDPSRSYAGIGLLLQAHINGSDPQAWEKIKSGINYTYEQLDLALTPLRKATGFDAEVQTRLKRGKKLFFKPNLVGVTHIDPQSHGPGDASTMNTEWAFVAALMRWFHDKLGVSYHQMAIGEASCCMPMAAAVYSMANPAGKAITTEAAIEGKSGEFHGGWGFYFARKYLAETLQPGRTDDPMKGYEESIDGRYIPPGHCKDKLMVYDLNRISDDPPRGRSVNVPDGSNFRSITLHKAIVGGNPADAADREAYPGCILVNVPKFKVHSLTLFTNVIKNLGIGLYPMQSASTGKDKWDYSLPHGAMPGLKGGIPHEVWIAQMDPQTGTLKKDSAGRYSVKKTGGITATMIDIIKAVANQDTFMLHIVDGIEAINLDHAGGGQKEPEGMVFAGLDPVATDQLCARYMFSNVTLAEAVKVGLDDGSGGHFPQKVPMPAVEGTNIVTQSGYDCPLSRDSLLKNAEARGLGKRKYFVVGQDAVTDHRLVSIEGHLGTAREGSFSDLITTKLYFDVYKMPWDLQKTTLAYFECVDRLRGSGVKKEFLETFDEDADGIVTYEESGKRGMISYFLFAGARSLSIIGTEKLGFLRGPFESTAARFRLSRREWNQDGHDLMRDSMFSAACIAAYNMSQRDSQAQDPVAANLTWGKGKWPSYELAAKSLLFAALYGDAYPTEIGSDGLYGMAMQYADLTQNNGNHTKSPGTVNSYVSAVLKREFKPLDFVLYVPAGHDTTAGGAKLPNVEVTADPTKMLTAVFAGGKETWG